MKKRRLLLTVLLSALTVRARAQDDAFEFFREEAKVSIDRKSVV